MNTRTAKLWLLYLNMIYVLKLFIKAERTGNWELHLSSVQCMLPYFAAAGHNLYTKSAYVYLQHMQQLHLTHPDVHMAFQNGFHVVRRTEKLWAGLSTDLVIEQVLMRSVKATGGLTRGRGMNEVTRLQWLLSMPSRARINEAMQCYTGTIREMNEQHKENRQSRKNRDMADVRKVARYLLQRNPFTEEISLRSIATGITAASSVNVDQADEVGMHIISEMEGKAVWQYSFKKKDQAITLDCKAAIKINEEKVNVDSQLLFQRLSVIAQDSSEDNAVMFAFELSTYPGSLFESPTALLPCQKSSLADYLWKQIQNDNSIRPTGNISFVLDGGALLHRIPWKIGESYSDIYKNYCNYVSKRYGYATIVFDGYEHGPSTKDYTHMRRATNKQAVNINFEDNMKVNHFRI